MFLIKSMFVVKSEIFERRSGELGFIKIQKLVGFFNGG